MKKNSHYRDCQWIWTCKHDRDFPGRPVVKTWCLQCRGHRFDPWLENWNPTSYMVWKKKKLESSFPHSHFTHSSSDLLYAWHLSLRTVRKLENCFLKSQFQFSKRSISAFKNIYLICSHWQDSIKMGFQFLLTALMAKPNLLLSSPNIFLQNAFKQNEFISQLDSSLIRKTKNQRGKSAVLLSQPESFSMH